MLATAETVLVDRPHPWHLSIADRLVDAAPDLIRRTDRVVVDVADDASRAAAVDWWRALTDAGGEGMVVKPTAGLPLPDGSPAKLPQPGLKVRGPEYLRLIYGPDHTRPEHLERLRQRSLGHKRSLAIREATLGLEALLRWTAGEPLHRVHECVFAVLALESEPVDPRL